MLGCRIRLWWEADFGPSAEGELALCASCVQRSAVLCCMSSYVQCSMSCVRAICLVRCVSCVVSVRYALIQCNALCPVSVQNYMSWVSAVLYSLPQYCIPICASPGVSMANGAQARNAHERKLLARQHSRSSRNCDQSTFSICGSRSVLSSPSLDRPISHTSARCRHHALLYPLPEFWSRIRRTVTTVLCGRWAGS